jgi:hypothetical protein
MIKNPKLLVRLFNHLIRKTVEQILHVKYLTILNNYTRWNLLSQAGFSYLQDIYVCKLGMNVAEILLPLP